MEARELRIGNLIFDSEGFEHEIEGYELYVNLVENCKPIPLTEEWLLRFGFENTYDDYWVFELLTLEKIQGEFFKLADGYYKDSIAIKSVHHLQNLYFALAGEELTLKTDI